MNCAGCSRTLDVGDQYIEDTASGFMSREADPMIDGLIAEVLGGTGDGKVIYCEDCTEPGGDYRLSTYYGDEANDDT